MGRSRSLFACADQFDCWWQEKRCDRSSYFTSTCLGLGGDGREIMLALTGGLCGNVNQRHLPTNFPLVDTHPDAYLPSKFPTTSPSPNRPQDHTMQMGDAQVKAGNSWNMYLPYLPMEPESPKLGHGFETREPCGTAPG